VTDGKIVASRGPGTSIDFALEFVEQLAGRGKRLEVESGLVMMR
jgi:4-methyl-5(b-hydroxyethyl)-thiazole monophosphate biosynthesis